MIVIYEPILIVKCLGVVGWLEAWRWLLEVCWRWLLIVRRGWQTAGKGWLLVDFKASWGEWGLGQAGLWGLLEVGWREWRLAVYWGWGLGVRGQWGLIVITLGFTII